MMWSSCLVAVALASPGVAAAPAPPGTGKNCLGVPRAAVVADQALVLSANPTGPEHQVEVATCRPLLRRPGALFDLTNLKLGAMAVTSLAYHHQGFFAAVSPLSVLEFRAEAHGVVQWPLFVDGAGYHPRAGYRSVMSGASMRRGDGRLATGWNVVGKAIGRLKVAVGPVSLVATDTAGLELWELGREPYAVNMRKDLVLARRDVVLTNTALFLVEAGLPAGGTVRVGAMDEVAAVPRAAYARHRVAGVATLGSPAVGTTLRAVQGFCALGVHTHHALRAQQPFMVLGLSASYLVL
jgi:hypothetical protein